MTTTEMYALAITLRNQLKTEDCITPDMHAAANSIYSLPAERNDLGFQTYFNSLINTYADALNNLPVEDVIHKADLQVFNTLCDALKGAMSQYLNEQPSISYNVLADALTSFDAYLPLDSISSDMST